MLFLYSAIPFIAENQIQKKMSTDQFLSFKMKVEDAFLILGTHIVCVVNVTSTYLAIH